MRFLTVVFCLVFVTTLHAQTEKICKGRMYFQNMRYAAYVVSEKSVDMTIEKYAGVLLYKNPSDKNFLLQWSLNETVTRTDWVPAYVSDGKDTLPVAERDTFPFSVYPIADLPMVWVKENYMLNGVDHEIFRFSLYNCYAGACGSMHGHVRMLLGEFFFSPVFGPLVVKRSPSRYQILLDGNETAPSPDLILAILRKNNMPRTLINRYTTDMKPPRNPGAVHQ